MAPHFEYRPATFLKLQGFFKVQKGNISFFSDSGFGKQFSCAEIMPYMPEYPWPADTCPSDHDSIDTIPVKHLLRDDRAVNIAIPDYRYFNQGIAFYSPN